MGLKTSSPIFQRLLEHVLRGLHWTTCVICLDDHICLEQYFGGHLRNLTDILKKTQRSRVNAKYLEI